MGKYLPEVARGRDNQDIVIFLGERTAGRHDEREETEDQEDKLTVFLIGWKKRMAKENDTIKLSIA